MTLILRKIRSRIQKALNILKKYTNRSGERFIIRFIRSRMISRYLKNNNHPRLHLGCGPRNFKGWLNADFMRSPSYYLKADPQIIPMDICFLPLPFPDNSIEFVYSEHVHEHITYNQGFLLAKEIKRILKPGGIFRVAGPNVDLYLDLFNRELTEEEKPIFDKACDFLGITAGNAPKTPLSLLNITVGEGFHEYCYNFQTLSEQLKNAGFSSVSRVEVGQSEHDGLKDMETSMYGRRQDELLLKMALWHTFVVEATK
ncbi:MAG: hypothetical protein A2Y40_05265 [Candidatus Margulisbacteria bacterium GWF2_35_9]|nr:MAG: hypothetical protein A2Y40_05265 [Candidatus Margulisbacteria bacterium GWF2_35_9]